MAKDTAQKGRNDGAQKGNFKEVQKEFKEELLGIDRVTRVTAGGRQLRFRASVVIGNEKGTIGLGTGKAGEVVVAIEKAIRDAKKNLITFPIVNGTIPHDIKAEYKAASIMVHPAAPGTGIIAGGAARKIFSVSGVKDILSKRYGSTNPITNARAALKALSLLKKDVEANKFAKKATAESTEAPVAATAEAVEAPKAAKKAPAKKAAAPKTEAAAKKPAAKKTTKKDAE